MLCERCKKLLIKKQIRWCSIRCSKLGLKSLYKKRNRDKINQYNRQYNKGKRRGSPSTNEKIAHFLNRNNYCAKCKGENGLQVCHVIPRQLAKNHDSLIVLCRKHHFLFDKILRSFWKI